MLHKKTDFNSRWITPINHSFCFLKNSDCLKDDLPTHHNSFVHYPVSTIQNTNVKHKFYRVENLLHKKHTLHYLKCSETIHKLKANTTATTHFVRITNLLTTKSIIKNLSKAGRLRWKIENEGLTQRKIMAMRWSICTAGHLLRRNKTIASTCL